MSIETSIETLASALTTHAAAIRELAAAIKAGRAAANAEHFSMPVEAAPEATADQSAAAPVEAVADQRTADQTKEPEPVPEASAADPLEAEIPNAIKVKADEDPEDPPFEVDRKEAPKQKKAARESEPVAERGAAGKISEKKPEAPKLTLENARQVASSVLKTKGADTLRSLLDAVGVKKLSALNADQISAFCANAAKALEEA